jgi:hypothetical protein
MSHVHIYVSKKRSLKSRSDSKLIKSFVCFIVCRNQPSQEELRVPILERNYWIGMSEELDDSEGQTTQRTKTNNS